MSWDRLGVSASADVARDMLLPDRMAKEVTR